jgi:arsenate reductase
MQGGLDNRESAAYVIAQIGGALVGVALANLMFEFAAFEWSKHERTGGGVWLGEVIATFGLVLLILALTRTGRGALAPYAVGAYIGAAYFFSSSTSFANPAVTLGRSLTDTFAGIAPSSLPTFVVCQLVGALMAIGAARVLYPSVTTEEVVL